MTGAARQMFINLNVHGTHVAEWLHPDTDLERYRSFERLSDFTRRAEAAGVDSVFFSDGVSYKATGGRDSVPPRLDPLSLASALAAQTSGIGFVVTSSTTYNEPYNLARQFASIDHISGGRIAWNMVTTASTAAAANFGADAHPSHPDRYRRAGEFVDVVTKLWESWDPDAVEPDRDAGVFVRPERVHSIDHDGEFFRVAGPLNVTRSPQGRPVLFQAGASADGLEFAARHAEVVYSISQTLDEAKQFYDTLKSKVSDLGRNPDDFRIVNGVRVLTAPTQAEAEEKFAELELWVDPLTLLHHLGGIIGTDLTNLSFDDPVPELPPTEQATGMQTHLNLLKGFIAREKPATVRDLVTKMGGGVGAPNITGDPVFVADWLESWFNAGVTDGFNVGFQVNDSGADPFFDLVIPELVHRGLRPAHYTSSTLRERFGLPRY